MGAPGFGLASAIFALIAAYFLYSGFTLEVTVENPMGEGSLERVANLQLMHIQQLNFATGIGAGIISSVLAATATIVGVLQTGRQEPTPPSE